MRTIAGLFHGPTSTPPEHILKHGGLSAHPSNPHFLGPAVTAENPAYSHFFAYPLLDPASIWSKELDEDEIDAVVPDIPLQHQVRHAHRLPVPNRSRTSLQAGEVVTNVQHGSTFKPIGCAGPRQLPESRIFALHEHDSVIETSPEKLSEPASEAYTRVICTDITYAIRRTFGVPSVGDYFMWQDHDSSSQPLFARNLARPTKRQRAPPNSSVAGSTAGASSSACAGAQTDGGNDWSLMTARCLCLQTRSAVGDWM